MKYLITESLVVIIMSTGGEYKKRYNLFILFTNMLKIR